jgi:hypothetical protein
MGKSARCIQTVIDVSFGSTEHRAFIGIDVLVISNCRVLFQSLVIGSNAFNIAIEKLSLIDTEMKTVGDDKEPKDRRRDR